MSDSETLKNSFKRVKKLLTIKPEKGQYTTTTKVRVRNGTTCEIEHKHWTFTADVGEMEGGNDAGPGPSVLQRGALGSCLAIGYAKWAAYLDVPIDGIEVDVEADVDARGAYGLDGIEPGYQGLRYKVYIDSPASEEEIMNVIEQADSHSPVLMDFKQPVEVEREVNLVKRQKEKVKSPSYAKASESK
ncbi:OsmC family protein [Rhodohalobacter sp.]|uniref:OsmC family protein n=1 Tax=Rhodohalobacter sp. TaxID=1974210 RepID=UPI002ACEB0A7|nr:OsmC family protein [Rhodohalobacter sp.]MDZ7758136.1 OsmC family protein [Rhodohalobacter sp.]